MRKNCSIVVSQSKCIPLYTQFNHTKVHEDDKIFFDTMLTFCLLYLQSIGGTSYKCEVCNKIFTKKSAFEIHSRVHTGIKPYGCHICSKAFSIHGNLKRHLLIHSGERPYKCSKCSKCFNNPSHLSRHIKANHPDAG